MDIVCISTFSAGRWRAPMTLLLLPVPMEFQSLWPWPENH